MSKKNWLNLFNSFSFIIFLFIYYKISGEEGMGIFAVSLSLYYLIFVVLMGSVKNTLAKMVAARIKRGFVDNARKTFTYTISYTVIISIFMFIIFATLSNSIMYLLFGNNIAGFVLTFFGIVFIVQSLFECIKGYYLGNGGNIFVIVADIVKNLVFIIGGPFLANVFLSYGEKVALLKKNSVFIGTYSSIGAVGVMGIAYFLGLLILIIGFRTIGRRDNYSFNEVRTRDGIKTFLRNFLPYAFKELQDNIFPVVILVFYISAYMRTGIRNSINESELYIGIGNMFIPLCVIALSLTGYKEFCNGQRTKLKIDYRKEDRKGLLIRFNALLKNGLTIILPLFLILFIGAGAIANGVFGTSIDSAKTLVIMGAFCLLLAGIDMIFSAGLDAVDLGLMNLIGNIAGFIVGIILLIASSKNGLKINMVMLALILNYLVKAIIHGVFAVKNIGAKVNDIVAKVVKIVIACFIMAIIELILVKFIAMNIFTFILTVIVSLAIYIVIFSLMQGYNQKELNYMYGALMYYPLNFASLLFHIR